MIHDISASIDVQVTQEAQQRILLTRMLQDPKLKALLEEILAVQEPER